MKILRIFTLAIAIILIIIDLIIVLEFRILNKGQKGLSNVDMKYLNGFIFVSESILLYFYFLLKMNSKKTK